MVSVLAPGQEGDVDLEDLELKKKGAFSLGACLRHGVVMTDFAFEELAKREENGGVGFVHAFPGWVKTGFARGGGVVVGLGMRVLLAVLTPWVIDRGESGERHLWVGSSGAFPGRGSKGGEVGEGKGEQAGEVEVARGSDGVKGSGAYLVGEMGQVVGKEKVLEGLRKRGAGPKIWEHTVEVFGRVEKGGPGLTKAERADD